MNAAFDLPVTYNGQTLIFKATVVRFGYIHQIQIPVHDYIVIFEPDEERNYRAIVDPSYFISGKSVDTNLIQAIGEAIESARA
jgi:hypothetical protein